MDSADSPKTIHRPRISVLIIAFQRKKYLLRAIQSALNQDGMDSAPEVVVVKDFQDPGIDEYIERHGVRGITTTAGPVGAYLVLGIQAATGEIVSFLDDDDTFFSTKLSKVARAFSEDPGLVYFHNGHEIRYDDGTPAPSLLHKPIPASVTLKGGISPPREIERLVTQNLPINLSCVSVRRDVLITHVQEIRQMSGATDYMAFYTALAQGGTLRFDGEVLSTYQIHKSAMRPGGSAPTARISMARLANEQLKVHTYGANLPLSVGVSGVAAGLEAQWTWLLCLMEEPSRSNLARTYLRFLRLVLRMRPRYVLLSLPIELGGLLSPLLGQRLFLALRSVASH